MVHPQLITTKIVRTVASLNALSIEDINSRTKNPFPSNE